MRAMLSHRALVASVVEQTAAKSYLEVGVRDGDSVLAALRSGSINKLALCDTWGLPHGGTNRGDHRYVESELLRVGYTGSILWLDGRSKEQLPSVSRLFDVTHVDGDHSESGALLDLQLVWPLTALALIVHDIFMSSVWAATCCWLRSCDAKIVELSHRDTGSLVAWRHSA